jgi:hypothetical protein
MVFGDGTLWENLLEFVLVFIGLCLAIELFKFVELC